LVEQISCYINFSFVQGFRLWLGFLQFLMPKWNKWLVLKVFVYNMVTHSLVRVIYCRIRRCIFESISHCITNYLSNDMDWVYFFKKKRCLFTPPFSYWGFNQISIDITLAFLFRRKRRMWLMSWVVLLSIFTFHKSLIFNI
jgi:hypothetical protein